jgi:hypothetical protein
MTAADLEIFKLCTGRSIGPTMPARRANTVKGRRSGWSTVQGRFLAPFYSVVRRHRLGPGERGIVQLVCPDRRQAGVLLDFAADGLAEIPSANACCRA